jgi:hypothetical protein
MVIRKRARETWKRIFTLDTPQNIMLKNINATKG